MIMGHLADTVAVTGASRAVMSRRRHGVAVPVLPVARRIRLAIRRLSP